MKFDVEDIDFSKIGDHKVFEELCFEILYKLGFQELKWRQGSSDNGRDIEGIYYSNSPLIGVNKEKWFIECKFYSSGVPVTEISSKIDWADVERANKLLIITNSHLTNQAREYIEKRQPLVKTEIHSIEGVALKKLIVNHEEIVSKFFIDEKIKLLNEAKKNWLIFNVYPQAEIIDLYLRDLDMEKLENSDCVFLLCAHKVRIDDLHDFDDLTNIFNINQATYNYEGYSHNNMTLLSDIDSMTINSYTNAIDDWNSIYRYFEYIEFTRNDDRGVYLLVTDSKEEVYEYLMMANSNFPVVANFVDVDVKEFNSNIRSSIIQKLQSQRNENLSLNTQFTAGATNK